MIVLDTHTLIWLFQGDTRLGRSARDRIETEAVEDCVLVPAICAWEVALVARRQTGLALEPEPWMRRVLRTPGYMLAPLEPSIAIASVDLSWHHKDPADRMIVATAQHWAAPLLTVDSEILAYAAAGHLHAIDATH